MSFLTDLFRKKSPYEIEDELTNEIITENEKLVRETMDSEMPATVIHYIPADDENVGVNIEILVDTFHCRMLPEIGSIIWISDESGSMKPHKVVRFDYIENNSQYDVMRVYIVVEYATNSDVLPNPQFVK